MFFNKVIRLETVINEGDMGNKFYIVLEGILVAYKEINKYSLLLKGYFDLKLALLNNTPRQAQLEDA